MADGAEQVEPATPRAPAAAAAAEPEWFCPQCAYNLRGIESDRCPECGRPIDRTTLSVSRIPWVHRREIGRIRAFWRTVWMATVRPGRLAAECVRPVSYRDAVRFRWLVVLTFWTPIAAAAAVWWMKPLPRKDLLATVFASRMSFFEDVDFDWVLRLLVAPGSLALTLVGLLLWAVGATGIAGWWFHPRRLTVVQQNRAVALSQYAAAPLAIFPLSLMLPALVGTMIAVVLGWDEFANALWSDRMIDITWRLSWVPAYFVFLLWWLVTLRLLVGTTDCGWVRILSAAVAVPVLVLLWAMLLAFIFHVGVSFIVLVFTRL